MTSSSEDSDGERMRLQEAVTGIPVKSEQGPSKKKRPSKRATITVDNDSCSKLVSTDMQTFLAKKLSEHLDSVYELVSSSHTTCESRSEPEASLSDSTKTTASAVRLFYNSLQPVTLDRQHTAAVGKQVEETASKTCLVKVKRKRKEPPSDSGSSESESEVARLREAAVDASTLLQYR